ncbi:MAG: T9SS type A sorting domain-containing protein [Flavobacteriales bacterium]|nr:T9SS type A sorting domain-containing protein [Flavobacteriales bacterium]
MRVNEAAVFEGGIVYPNPASNEVVVQTQFPRGLVEVYDTNGRVVLSTEFTEPTFQLTLFGISEGMYHTRILTPEGEAKHARLLVKH